MPHDRTGDTFICAPPKELVLPEGFAFAGIRARAPNLSMFNCMREGNGRICSGMEIKGGSGRTR